MLETKVVSTIEIKDAAKGEIEAVFSTFNVKDHDNDLTLPGAFEAGAKVRISAFGHGSWAGALPVGKGAIRTTAQDARLVGKFFLSTEHGRDTFETMKGLGELGQWSYGFDVLERGELTEELRQRGVVRVLKRLKVHEVSPVLVGAGVGTRTVVVKAAGDGEEAELRAAALTELARFEHRRFLLNVSEAKRRRDELEAHDRPKHWDEIAEEHEIPAWRVHDLRRRAAAQGIALALAALDAEDDPPSLKWFLRTTAAAPWGFSSPTGAIWVSAELDVPQTVAVAAHEVAHQLDHDEVGAERLAALVRAAFVSKRRISGGHWRKFQNRPDSKPGDIVVSPDLSAAWMRRDAIDWDPI